VVVLLSTDAVRREMARQCLVARGPPDADADASERTHLVADRRQSVKKVAWTLKIIAV